jgi:hypothetical protein
MKPVFLLVTFVAAFTTNLLCGQQSIPATPETHKQKMELFKNWVGQWEGEGTIQRGPQNSSKSTVTEKIEMKLDGGIVVIEGIGKATDVETKTEKVVHHAFGVLSYDVLANKYRLESYLADGKSTEAWFNVIGENKYQWGFDTPQGKIRYTITIDPVANTWEEIGEFTRDEKTWYRTFEMKLKKV